MMFPAQWLVTVFVVLILTCGPAQGQAPTESERLAIQSRLDQLSNQLDGLSGDTIDDVLLVDVQILAKAAEWILRHNEFYKPEYSSWTAEMLDLGLRRSAELADGKASWVGRTQVGQTEKRQASQYEPGRIGTTVCGYRSKVDGSVQPFAVSLPAGFDSSSDRRWPLHVELHGRGSTLNEVSFVHAHEGKPPRDDQTWIQLDVFGRTNNAYRWAGESDVLEALAAVKERFPVDEDRITLRGFSMGGAGAWHLGMHYPSLWSSVGAGAGFCDTVHHLSLTSPLEPLHSELIHIYDAQDYALNAFNVPTIGYGGELDKQLFASGRVTERAAEFGVTIRRLIGPMTEHKWHPDSLREFMAFHSEHTQNGRLASAERKQIRLRTHTVKYGHCDWLTIEQQLRPYAVSHVDAQVAAVGTQPTDNVSPAKKKHLEVTTENVAVLQIRSDAADSVVLDGGPVLTLRDAASSANNQNPDNQTQHSGVFFERTGDSWQKWDRDQTERYENGSAETDRGLIKRPGLQGPIDDAFMQPFLCVRPSGRPWSESQALWSRWTMARFDAEFDKWLRGRIPVVNDTDLTDDQIREHNLILFGDPGSNAVLARVLDRLPVTWTRETLTVNGQEYPADRHGMALIYPNPLNARRYVVVNSGHTFHEPQFQASNANLFPRLGDIAVVRFEERGNQFDEHVEWADVFDAKWQFRAAAPASLNDK